MCRRRNPGRGVTCADNPCCEEALAATQQELVTCQQELAQALDDLDDCEDAEVTCDDGVDNDCDGLVDAEDPDCGGAGCPGGYPDRMPSQVVTDLFAAIAVGDEVLAACNYYEDATAINDQGICLGVTDIIAAHFSMFDFFGVGITGEDLVAIGNYVRLLYSVEGNGFAVEDGVLAFHIEGGRIRNHIDHSAVTQAGGG